MPSRISLLFLFVSLFVFSSKSISAEELPSNNYLNDLIEEAADKKLADRREWRLLLHYHRSFFGQMKSDIDGPDFFLSKQGRTNLQEELNATLTAFFDPLPISTDTQHPQCRFPARFSWLDEQLHFDQNMPKISCERFEAWKEKIDPGSVAIVFSGYYLNNPASMYGHTFLRIGRKSAERSPQPLLDYTINFSARTRTTNGLVFALRGLAGGYPGTFTTLPYYMKVQQYNNLESRDLWEYKLSIDQTGLDRLIQHLWEMGPTSISYYFFNKNCSYQLLPMLEVANPRLQLSERFQFRAIPIDTLRAVLESPGLFVSGDCRPSALHQMVAARDLLTKPERKIASSYALKETVKEKELNELSVERQRLVLDAAYNYLHYHEGFQRAQPKEVQERERRILMAMSVLPISSTKNPVNVSCPPSPHLSHKTGRWGLAVGANRDTSFEEISIRGALHDTEADQEGFINGSQLEMMSLRLRLENEQTRLMVEDATAVHVWSMTPWEEWIHKQSWRVQIHYTRAHDLDQNPEGSGYASVNGGSGVTVRIPFLTDSLIYSMVELDSGVGNVFDDYWRAGVGVSAGVVVPVLRKWRAHLHGSVIRYGLGNLSTANRLRLTQAWQLPRSWETRLVLDRQNHYREGILSINRYF